MYSKELTKELQKQSLAFLKSKEKSPISVKEISTLREVLRFHEHRYYILNDPLISDFEYDQLFKELEKIEEENPR